MLIYGSSKALNVKGARVPGVPCPSCQASDSIEAAAYARYAHVYWIPLFSLGKSTVVSCASCGAEFKGKKVPSQASEMAQKLKSEVTIPIWHFAGIGIVAVLIAIGVYSSIQDDAQNERFLAAPAVGDIYEMKTEEGNFTVFRIEEVGIDSLEVRPSDYEVNKRSGLSDLHTDDRYSEYVFNLARTDIKEMFDSGEIIDIER